MTDLLMRNWIREYQNNPGVIRWLSENPPPAEWQGTPMEWAFEEMPFVGVL